MGLHPTVPVMAPLLVLMCRPAGRPEAEYFTVPPESLALIESDTVSPSVLV